MGRRRFLLVGVLLPAMGFAGCGGASPGGQPGDSQGPGGGTPSDSGGATSSGSGNGSTAGDACTLLLADEVWAITSSDPVTGSSDPQAPGRCTFLTTDTSARVGFLVWTAPAGKKNFEATRANGGWEDIPGIGDQAMEKAADLLFTVGDNLFEVYPSWGTNEQSQAQAVLMAKVVAARFTTGSVPAGLIPTTPPVLASKDPCKLLSGEEAATALKSDELTAVNNDSGGSNQPLYCYYNLADGSPVLTTYLDPKGGLADFESLFAGVEVEAVDGLGDKSVFDAFEGRLYTLKGDAILSVNAYTVAPDKVLDVDRQLMEIILSHI